VIDTIDVSYYTAVTAIGKRKRVRQPTISVTTRDLPRSVAHPFYARLTRVLDKAGFDVFAEGRARRSMRP
jgi:hypothetical protein